MSEFIDDPADARWLGTSIHRSVNARANGAIPGGVLAVAIPQRRQPRADDLSEVRPQAPPIRLGRRCVPVRLPRGRVRRVAPAADGAAADVAVLGSPLADRFGPVHAQEVRPVTDRAALFLANLCAYLFLGAFVLYVVVILAGLVWE